MATITVPQAIDLARQCLETGRLADSEGILRQVLERDGKQAEAYHLLGIIAYQVGRHDVAAEILKQAIFLDPISAQYRNTQGLVRHARGELDEAIGEFRCALKIEPGLVEAQNNLGNALRAQGRLQDALESFRAALSRRPDYVEARNNLGNLLRDLGQPAEAAAEYRAVLSLFPDSVPVHNNLGTALGDLGDHEAAVAEFRAALALSPIFPQAQFNLGNTLRQLGHFGAAAEAYRGVLSVQPDLVEAHLALSAALRATGESEFAIASAETAVRLRPDLAATHNALGNALQEGHRPAEAIAAYRIAIERQADFSDASNNLGNALKDQGEIAEALVCYRKALSQTPDDAVMHSNLVYSMLFDPGADPATLRMEGESWDRRHVVPLREKIAPHRNTPDPHRRLRIGYVSPNFSRHVISHFLTPLLEAHDRENFEIFCYASVKRPDHITDRLRKSAQVWRDVIALRDEELAACIRKDEIDILVDLTQHLAGNRLLTFARKPAPIQIAWVGYPGTTGLRTMDYRFTDAFMEPEGAPWSESVENAVRLPDSWFCFDPLEDYPAASALPASGEGYVTFGSLNNFCKMNDAVVELWARVLLAVEGSRLLLQCPEGGPADRARQSFASRGVDPERVQLIARTATREEFLEVFQRIDIALDPFPYNGGTTTCEALWMGIPVLTLPGSVIVSRIGLSILSSVGLPELVAHSAEDFVALAARLAGDLPRLAELRATLRERMKASAFMDGARFAMGVEQGYRKMWAVWCAGR